MSQPSPEPEPEPKSVTPSTLSPQSGTGASSPTETPIRLVVGDTVLTARLTDSEAAQDLLSRLPLTVTFRDFNGVEKIAQLPQPLSTSGSPAGADPDIGDIGYYSPSSDLVLYYGEVGYFNGIVRLGRFDTDMSAIQAQAADFTITIER